MFEEKLFRIWQDEGEYTGACEYLEDDVWAARRLMDWLLACQ